jgi:hypothetical protein
VNAATELGGFQLSALAQARSAAPLNITSGVTTIQGTAGRPVVAGTYIPRNAASGNPFFTLDTRVSRSFGVWDSVRLELLAEAFNVTNRANVLTRNTNFGAGTYPTAPSSSFMQITSVGEPRTLQLGVRVQF